MNHYLLFIASAVPTAVFVWNAFHIRGKLKAESEKSAFLLGKYTDSIKAYEELKAEKQPTVIKVGFIEKYTEDDIKIIRSSPGILSIIMKIMTYHAAMKTDSLRNPDIKNVQCTIGEANAMHEMLIFFYNLSIPDEKNT